MKAFAWNALLWFCAREFRVRFFFFLPLCQGVCVWGAEKHMNGGFSYVRERNPRSPISFLSFLSAVYFCRSESSFGWSPPAKKNQTRFCATRAILTKINESWFFFFGKLGIYMYGPLGMSRIQGCSSGPLAFDKHPLFHILRLEDSSRKPSAPPQRMSGVFSFSLYCRLFGGNIHDVAI